MSKIRGKEVISIGVWYEHYNFLKSRGISRTAFFEQAVNAYKRGEWQYKWLLGKDLKMLGKDGRI